METRPKDGMFRRFTEPVMDQICALVPDFHGPDNLTLGEAKIEANKFYKKMRRYKWFERRLETAKEHSELATTLPDEVTLGYSAYRCTYQATTGEIDLCDKRHSKMEILHIVAHYLQPAGGPWHGGQFGSVFLDLIERVYDADIKRAAKDIMINNNIKTSVRSPGTREKQSNAYYERKIKQAPQKLAKILQEMRELQGE